MVEIRMGDEVFWISVVTLDPDESSTATLVKFHAQLPYIYDVICDKIRPMGFKCLILKVNSVTNRFHLNIQRKKLTD